MQHEALETPDASILLQSERIGNMSSTAPERLEYTNIDHGMAALRVYNLGRLGELSPYILRARSEAGDKAGLYEIFAAFVAADHKYYQPQIFSFRRTRPFQLSLELFHYIPLF